MTQFFYIFPIFIFALSHEKFSPVCLNCSVLNGGITFVQLKYNKGCLIGIMAGLPAIGGGGGRKGVIARFVARFLFPCSGVNFSLAAVFTKWGKKIIDCLS
jgi:hypothetical protein